MQQEREGGKWGEEVEGICHTNGISVSARTYRLDKVITLTQMSIRANIMEHAIPRPVYHLGEDSLLRLDGFLRGRRHELVEISAEVLELSCSGTVE